jgi:periplasmic protein TonB
MQVAVRSYEEGQSGAHAAALDLGSARFQVRWFSALALSACTSLGLFWLMYSVIHYTGHGVNKLENLPTVDFVRLKHDVEPPTVERHKPTPPPPPQQPPPPSKIQIDVSASATGPAISMPTNLGLNAGTGGPASGPGIGQMDSDLIPLQRIPPAFPVEARRAGVSGWVDIDVTIAADGSVHGARVVGAKPKGVFEAAAVTAIQKWRFKPKVVDGKAVEFHAVQKIEFNLNNS